MTTSPRSFSPLVIVAVAAVWWVLVLSSLLRHLFGASITGGWLIVGAIFSLVGFGVILLIKEFNDAILIPVCKSAVNHLGFPVSVSEDDSGVACWIEQHDDRSRRSELGLAKTTLSVNRPRMIQNKKCGEQLDFRISFERVIAANSLAA